MSYEYSEDKLAQETTAAHFAEALGWESVFAYNDEVLGPDGSLGRLSQTEVVLTRHVRHYRGSWTQMNIEAVAVGEMGDDDLGVALVFETHFRLAYNVFRSKIKGGAL